MEAHFNQHDSHGYAKDGSIRGMRVRTGCNTCRKRHVKCDEQRPICANCSRGKRECVFPLETLFRNIRSKSTTKAGVKRAVSHDSTSRDLDESTSLLQSMNVSPTIRQKSASGEKEDSLFHFATIAADRRSFEGLNAYSEHPQSTAESSIRSSPSGIDIAEARESWIRLIDNPLTDLAGPTVVSQIVAPYYFHGTGVYYGAFGPETPVCGRTNILWSFDAPKPPFQDIEMSNDDQQSSEKVVSSSHTSVFPRTLSLDNHEVYLMRNYIKFDLLDIKRRFAFDIPRLAHRSKAVYYGCLALSAKQLYQIQKHNGLKFDQSRAKVEFGQYYDISLREMQNSLDQSASDGSDISDDLLVTAIILITFEVLDANYREFEQHLHGVQSFMKPSYAAIGGLKEAAFWCWYRQSTWAKWRLRQRMLNIEDFWVVEDITQLTEDQYILHIVFLMAKAINYSAEDELPRNQTHTLERHLEAEALIAELKEWMDNLPASFEPLMVTPGELGTEILIFNPAAIAVAHEVYHFALIVISMARPVPPDQNEEQHYFTQKQFSRASARSIIGIALARCAETYHLMSMQCLYAAGIVLDTIEERNLIKQLILECSLRTGRRTDYIIKELEEIWRQKQ